jgi:thiamine-phosphate pyrophosphorylase
MAPSEPTRCRLCLVTPADADPAAFAAKLAEALAAGDVASLIITANSADPTALERAAAAYVPIAQARGAAALVHNDTRIAGRSRADGVHVDAGAAELADAVEAFRPSRLVGAGGATTRHEAMALGEADPDYLFFGRLDGDTDRAIFPKALALAAWWSEIFVVPAIVMGGSALESVSEAAAAGIEFVALGRAVFDDPRGPAAAVAEANRRLAGLIETVP